MTRVCYYRNEYRLRAEGHAGAGEKGRDLICAAESILMMAPVSYTHLTLPTNSRV